MHSAVKCCALTPCDLSLQHKTAPASGSCPRFLKDVLFDVKEPQKESLMVSTASTLTHAGRACTVAVAAGHLVNGGPCQAGALL
jgi:hypothetical protein